MKTLTIVLSVLVLLLAFATPAFSAPPDAPLCQPSTAAGWRDFATQSSQISMCKCAKAVYFRWLDPAHRACTFTTTQACWGRVWLYNSPVSCANMLRGWYYCGA